VVSLLNKNNILPGWDMPEREAFEDLVIRIQIPAISLL